MPSKLFALSFDTLASPGVHLTPRRTVQGHTGSWGLAWYPEDSASCTILKDPADLRDDVIASVLQKWDRLRSTVYVMHTRGAAKRNTQQDTQPFSRTFCRRELVFAHSGDLKAGFDAAFPLGPDPLFVPMGRTDSEHVFCWLLTQLRRLGATTLAEAGWTQIQNWLRMINANGQVNLLLTDGVDLIAYRDMNASAGLHVIRRAPPFERTDLASEDLRIELDDPRDATRTYVCIATSPMTNDAWSAIPPGGMVVARRGQLIWDGESTPASMASSYAPPALSQQPVSLQEALLRSQRRPPISGPAVNPAMPAVAAEPVPVGEDVSPIDANAGSKHFTSPVHERGGRELTIEHETIYEYGEPVELSSHFLRMQPISDQHQELLEFSLILEPDGVQRSFEDVFGNEAVLLRISRAYQTLRMRMRAKVAIHVDPGDAPPHDRLSVPIVWMPWQRQMMHAYLLPPELPETQLQELSEYALSFVERQDYDIVEALREMNRTIYRDYQYVSGSTHLETTPWDVYTSRKGVCQDFANLFICMARLLGAPARYRMGYIFTGADYENRIQSDASHAWAEVYLPTIGWLGFDPTNGCEAGRDHIRVAAGRNFRDATPTSGTIFKGGGAETLSISVKVRDPLLARSRSGEWLPGLNLESPTGNADAPSAEELSQAAAAPTDATTVLAEDLVNPPPAAPPAAPPPLEPPAPPPDNSLTAPPLEPPPAPANDPNANATLEPPPLEPPVDAPPVDGTAPTASPTPPPST